MNRPTRPFSRLSADAGPAAPSGDAPVKQAQTSVNWAALHDAASAVAMLAGVSDEKASQRVRNFPAQVRDAEPWRKDLAESGIADIAAVMKPGLKALLAVRARGQDARAPARALLQEFYASRDALLAIIPESGAMGPRRSA